MANLLFFLALLIFPLFFLVQTVTIRFEYYNEPVISVDFILFALWFYPERKRKRKRKRKKNIKMAFRFLNVSKRPLEYFIKNSEIELRHFEIYPNENEPDRAALKLQGFRSFFSAFFALIESKAKKVTLKNRILGEYQVHNKDKGTRHIDILLYTSLKTMLFSFFQLVFSAFFKKR